MSRFGVGGAERARQRERQRGREQKKHFKNSTFLLSRFLQISRYELPSRYSFEYPSSWKAETIGKQQKGMVGIDSKVTNPRAKREF